MFPFWTRHYLFSLFISGMMSFLVSGVATYRALGLSDTFMGSWFAAWLPSWGVAFAAVLLVGPLARKMATALTRDPQ